MMNEQITNNGGRMILNSPKEIDKLLNEFGSVKVVSEWDWKDKFDNADDAIISINAAQDDLKDYLLHAAIS